MTDESEPAQPEDQQPIINIAGDKVALGPIRRDLIPLFQRWSNDFEVVRFLGTMEPSTIESEEDQYSRFSKAENQSYFTIYEQGRWRPIGATGLGDINHAHRTAEFYIMIGDKESWGKGYGTEVARLMLDYGFTCLGLHNISLWVHAENERGIRAYRRAGFRDAGHLRQFKWLGGRAYDFILMDCLATEFGSSVLHRLMPGPAEGGSSK